MNFTNGSSRLKCWLEALLGFFYPEVCQICGRQRAGPAEGYWCPACAEAVRFLKPPWCAVCGQPVCGETSGTYVCSECRENPPPYDYARSVLEFDGPVREAIHRYKYERALWLERRLAEWLVAAAAPALNSGQWQVIVPVPLHPLKQREREFNQAERLARHLSLATGLPLNTTWLKRVKNTPTQTRLNRAERAANMRGAFGLKGGQEASGRRVVLVDDVLTTGATVQAAAGTLRRGGAEAVCVWTLARGR